MVSKIVQNGFNRHVDAWNVGAWNSKLNNKKKTLNIIDLMFNVVLRSYNFNNHYYYGK